MDKKNTVIGVLLLVAAMVSFYLSSRYAPQPPPRPPAEVAPTTGSPLTGNEAPPVGPASSPANVELRAAPAPEEPAETTVLENEFISIVFTNAGAAIDEIALRKHLAELKGTDPYILNRPHAAPALSIAGFPGLDHHTRYTLVSRTDTEIVYTATVPDQLEVTRRYVIAAGSGNGRDPYHLRHETTFRNLTDKPLVLPRTAINLGTASPINADDYGIYLNVGYYDGDDEEFIQRSELEGGGFFTRSPPVPYIDKPANVVWASVKNQFFASVLTPDEPATGVRIERFKINPLQPDDNARAYGVTGHAQIDLKPLAPGASYTWGANYYAGPKEYPRLSDTDHFKKDEDLVMEFGFFGFFSKILLEMMTWVHGVIGGDSLSWGWGWSIVITTLILKIVFVPFTLAASRSSKRMAKLMPHVTALREKYKDSPQKMNEAMMRLYKENKVNPLGGCIPILITIPFFIGFFSMLQSAAELRFSPFLWAADLSAPDTVFTFGVVDLPLLGLTALNLNIMPLLMGATMIIQMRLTPMPSTDNAQVMMMKFMPWMFTLFCYNFSCALALYSTVNGAFTIGQQLVINRMPEPELPINQPAGASGSLATAKNVTPKKKKQKR